MTTARGIPGGRPLADRPVADGRLADAPSGLARADALDAAIARVRACESLHAIVTAVGCLAGGYHRDARWPVVRDAAAARWRELAAGERTLAPVRASVGAEPEP